MTTLYMVASVFTFLLAFGIMLTVSRGPHLCNLSVNKIRDVEDMCLPAATVSPPRRMRILPISLFTENGSKGIGCTEVFEYAVLRRVI